MAEVNIESVKERLEDSVKRSQESILTMLDNMIKKTMSGDIGWQLLEQDREGLVTQIKNCFRESDETIFLSQSYYCKLDDVMWIALNIMDGNDYKVDYLLLPSGRDLVIRCSEFFKEKGILVKRQNSVAEQRFVEMVNWLLLEIQQQFLNKSLFVIEQAGLDIQPVT
jgi:hypothetical protein